MTTRSQLKEVRAFGEGPMDKFKRDDVRPVWMGREFAALLNVERGYQ